MILVFTNRQDITADLVILKLRERGAQFARVNTEQFGGLTWTMDDGSETGHLALSGNRQIPLETITAIWLRRPKPPEPTSEIMDGAARSFAAQEKGRALRNLWGLLGDSLWVSHPEAIQRAELKLLQLRTARDLGFTTPDTLVTDQPGDAEAFLRKHGNVVAKAVHAGAISDPTAGDYTIFTSEVVQNDIQRLPELRFAPVMFQSLVRKKFDLRVTAVGRHVFATEIHTSDPTSTTDWRMSDPATLKHIPHKLPDQLSERILQMLRRYGLQFGAFDFLVTDGNDYVFLEINPNGQWGWIEQAIGTPISDAIADLLLNPGSHAC